MASRYQTDPWASFNILIIYAAKIGLIGLIGLRLIEQKWRLHKRSEKRALIFAVRLYVDTRQTEEQRDIRLSRVCHAISFLLHRVILIFDRSTLFVSNLPYTATSTDLNTLFSDIAPVRSAFVVLEHGTGASKGVGYVSFAIPEDAKAAFDSISADGIALDGRKLRIEWAANKVC